MNEDQDILANAVAFTDPSTGVKFLAVGQFRFEGLDACVGCFRYPQTSCSHWVVKVPPRGTWCGPSKMIYIEDTPEAREKYIAEWVQARMGIHDKQLEDRE
jgi:hypothetical protein